MKLFFFLRIWDANVFFIISSHGVSRLGILGLIPTFHVKMPPYPIPPPPPPPPPVPPAPRGGEFLKGTDSHALPQKIRLLFACRKEIFQGKKRRKMGKNMLGVWSLWDHAWKREFFAKKKTCSVVLFFPRNPPSQLAKNAKNVKERLCPRSEHYVYFCFIVLCGGGAAMMFRMNG